LFLTLLSSNFPELADQGGTDALMDGAIDQRSPSVWKLHAPRCGCLGFATAIYGFDGRSRS
jgi:hypothetical protein